MEMYFNGVPVTEEEMSVLIEAANEAIAAEEVAIMQEHGVSEETASAISYLRTRSRWTEAKEMELIQRDKSGDPIPLSDVLMGEF